jgi:tRNA(Ile)-lysidine synthase
MKEMSVIMEKVLRCLSAHRMLARNDGVVIGVSGGPDSVALLLALMDASRIRRLNLKLRIVHLNHRIRGREADNDEKFVRKLAARFRLPISVRKRDIRKIAAKQRKSLELVAREVRYGVYRECARKNGATKIALGHTSDDNAETFFFNLMRGAGFTGLGGIPPKRKLEDTEDVFIIRPLMEISRKEVLQFLREKGECFRLDSSNLRTQFYRNKIRHKLIPLIEKEFNPGIREHVSRLTPFFSKLDREYRRRAERLWKRAHKRSRKGELRFGSQALAAQEEILVGYFMRRVLDFFDEDARGLTFNDVRRMQKLFSSKGVHKSLRVGRSEVRVEKTANNVIFRMGGARAGKVPWRRLGVPGKAVYGKQGWRIAAELVEKPERLKRGARFQEIVDFEKAGGGGARFCVRSRRKGDVFRPLGMVGTKKLQDFFIDAKVPESERDGIPLVVSDEKIIWVVGHRISEGVKVDGNTRRFLKLSFIRSEKG